MTLKAWLNAIAQKITAALPAFKTVKTHAGRFDGIAELKRYAAVAPACLITLLDVRNIVRDNIYAKGTATFAAYIVTRDVPDYPRFDQSVDLVSALSLLIPEQAWGKEDDENSEIESPQNIRAQNLYSGSLDSHGVNIWMVTWDQMASIASGEESDELEPFNTFFAEHQLADGNEPSAADEVTIEQDQPEDP